METFKYARTTLNNVVGIIWILLAVMYLSIFLVLLFHGGNFPIIIFLIISILKFLIGIFYVRLYRRDYVTFDSQYITIDRGLVMSPFKASMSDIKIIKNTGDRIRIGLKSDKEYRIMLSSLSVFDIDRIEQILQGIET